ncbi:hypothetical protein [Phyllobacterium zundukense]|uniref:Lipoprotein n=1 Tax=Phyllobacterium zundukense TaxID=1867719 RepID=A0A2N9VU01_9HYPH|nr:hypothetical protein [Phyllobacterium zundukense]ATU93087.1 hypothetical protein BLM14_16800 [Phyllobacterium zundukense]PIO42969.1 hypothetical protein B5P45_21295 [Phyllobacterium zundukense]
MRLVVLAGLMAILSGCGGGAIARLNPAPAAEAQYRLGGCQLRGHGVCKDMQEFSGQTAQPAS